MKQMKKKIFAAVLMIVFSVAASAQGTPAVSGPPPMFDPALKTPLEHILDSLLPHDFVGFSIGAGPGEVPPSMWPCWASKAPAGLGFYRGIAHGSIYLVAERVGNHWQIATTDISVENDAPDKVRAQVKACVRALESQDVRRQQRQAAWQKLSVSR